MKIKPGLELEMVIATGQCNDDNYIIDKNGLAIWCTGECVLVTGKDGKDYIVKDVVNLQSKKQLSFWLTDTELLLERIFESSKEIPMMILDGYMKIKKINDAFLHLFEIKDPPADGEGLSAIPHPFWRKLEIKDHIRKTIVSRESMKQADFSFNTNSGEQKTVRLNSKITEGRSGSETKIFILLEELDE